MSGKPAKFCLARAILISCCLTCRSGALKDASSGWGWILLSTAIFTFSVKPQAFLGASELLPRVRPISEYKYIASVLRSICTSKVSSRLRRKKAGCELHGIGFLMYYLKYSFCKYPSLIVSP